MAADEPCLRFPKFASERRERQPFAFSCLCNEGFDGDPAFLERKRQQRLTGLVQQTVKQKQAGGRLARQALDAAGGGMKPHLQGVERRCSSTGRTSSPSSTKVLGESDRRFATTSGKNRDSDLPDFALISTSSPDLNARQRNPSHLGSNCQPGAFGSFGQSGPPSARATTERRATPGLRRDPSFRELIAPRPNRLMML